MAEPRHKRLYKNSPKLERGEGGHMDVVKPSQVESDREQAGIDGMKVSGELPAHVRHAHERRDMHNRHETEHAVHDNAAGGDKGEMHARHQREHTDMHKRHAKEYAKSEHNKDDNEKAGAGKKEIKEIRNTEEITE